MPIQQVMNDEGAKPVKLWTTDVETEALEQLRKTSRLPFIFKHIAVMPDVHFGLGSTVGSVVPTVKAIVPAAVGVDIGCGMAAVKLPLKASQLPDNLGEMRSAIEKAVPHGRTDNGGRNDRGAWGDPPSDVLGTWLDLASVDSRWLRLVAGHPTLRGKVEPSRQLGTLGGGNHFIELCLDTEGSVWVMLHSGSRGIGNKIGSYFINRAKEECERYFIPLEDTDLAYLPEDTILFNDYVSAVGWAQDYAKASRNIMLRKTIQAIEATLGMKFEEKYEMAVNCHHNYVEKENHFGSNVYVTRKGAVRAREGDLGIIPGSMGTKSYIVRGKGNAESFNSCSHGAGRRMSRREAGKRFSVEDLERQTAGVECRKDIGVIDEIPSAYKSIDDVMMRQTDLVDVVAELKQVLCVKG